MKKKVLGEVFNQRLYSKIGIITQHNYNHLRSTGEDYVKPDTPEEYYKVKYRTSKKEKLHDSSLDSSNVTQEKEESKQEEKKKEEKTPEKEILPK